MALILDGTSGLSDVDGTAGTPAIRGSDANTGIFFPAADTIAFAEGGVESMRLDSNGNVGIGTSSPAYRLDVNAATTDVRFNSTIGTNPALLRIINSGGTFFLGRDNSTGSNFGAAYASLLWNSGAQPILFATNDSERARIDSSGNLLVGTTSAGTNACVLTIKNPTQATIWSVGPSSGSGSFFVANASGTGVSLASGATSWAALSDERFKTNLKPIENAAQKVSQLRALTGRYISDEETVSRAFLIAQDVQAVLPEAVDTSNSDQLGLQYTDTIPLLVAAIKEQQAIIQSLTARIEALENQT